MDKVMLTKEQARALESFTIHESFNADAFLANWLKTGFMSDENQCLNKLSPTQMARCLLIGYEVDITKEEQLLKAYNECAVLSGGRWVQSKNVKAFRDGMVAALNIIGERVNGINE